MESDTLIPAVVLAVVFGFVIAAVIVLFLQKRSISHEEDAEEESEGDNKSKHKEKLTTIPGSKSKSNKRKGKGNKENALSHPLLITSLKGHPGSVIALDHSTCGKYLASAAEDRTVRLWKTKEILQKDHKFIQVNVELDYATCVGFSPDSKAFIVSLARDNAVRVFKLSKKKDEASSGLSATAEFDFPREHKGEIIYAGVAINGKFVMTVSKDTKMVLWTLKGEVLTTIDTLQVSNSCGAISPCGNLVASSGFTPDVKMWSIEFDKSAQFKQVNKALELKGHSSGVYSFSFSSDSRRVATASKAGIWRIYDIDVDYKKAQESYLLATGSFNDCLTNTAVIDHAIVALSPDGYCIAVAAGKSIGMINVHTKEMEEILTDVHGDSITALKWLTSSHELASAGGSDRTIRLWHCPTGARSMIADLKSKLPRAKTDLIRERIQNQIKGANVYLESIGYKM